MKLRRLAGMGPHEIYTRVRQEAGKRRDILLYRLGIEASSGRGCDFGSRGRFYCDPQDTPRIVDLLGRRMPEVVEEIVERARRIAERRFDLLGFQGLDFGKDVDWSLDPVHGRRAPLAPWPAIPYRDFSAVGDHKIVWELNRAWRSGEWPQPGVECRADAATITCFAPCARAGWYIHRWWWSGGPIRGRSDGSGYLRQRNQARFHLPKDLRALTYRAIHMDLKLPLLESVLPSNQRHLERGIDQVLDFPGGRIGIFGLAFKEDTDDLRESPVVAAIEQWVGKGKDVKVYDPHIRLDLIYGSNRNFVLNALATGVQPGGSPGLVRLPGSDAEARNLAGMAQPLVFGSARRVRTCAAVMGAAVIRMPVAL